MTSVNSALRQAINQVVEREYITRVPSDGDRSDMSMSTALNAVIAMLEDRPALFKELLRAPESNVRDITAVEARLRRAVNRYAATQMRTGLMKSLHVTPPSGEQDQVAFFAGVRATEEVFETLAETLDEPQSDRTA
jgi:hypothetical protein